MKTPLSSPFLGRRAAMAAGLSALSVLGAAGLAVNAAPAEAARCLTCDPGDPPPTRPPTTQPGVPPTAGVSWSLAPRAGGANDTDDPTALAAYVKAPDQLRLNACGSAAGSAPITSYQWTINGASYTGCAPTVSVPHQGSFTASVTVRDSAGLTASASTSGTYKDNFVVALGDSIASGEGNPATPQQYDAFGFVKAGPQWPNKMCHRSPLASSQQAAATFEAGHPHESVTYVNLACSGAKIVNVLQTPYGGAAYEGIEPTGTKNPPQLEVLETIDGAAGRTPDSVVLSAGANDFGFGPIAKQCSQISSVFEDHALCGDQLNLPVSQGATTMLGNAAKLGDAFNHAGIAAAKVSVSQYPDPTHTDSGALCDSLLGDTVIGTIHSFDVAWANGITNQLNNDVARAAATNHFNLVPGIASDFNTHGYCASNHWINTWSESNHNQGNDSSGNTDGLLHPNASGTNDYANRILQAQTAAGLLQ